MNDIIDHEEATWRNYINNVRRSHTNVWNEVKRKKNGGSFTTQRRQQICAYIRKSNQTTEDEVNQSQRELRDVVGDLPQSIITPK